MALKLENINNLIADDLAKRNENWTEIDNTFELKADKTYVDTNLSEKVQNFKIKNEIVNGDFSQGTTGFRTEALNISVINGNLTLLATSTGGRIYQVISNPYESMWYTFAKVKASSNQVTLTVPVGGVLQKHSGSDLFELLSGVSTVTNVGSLNFQIVRDNSTSGFDNIEIDFCGSVNLTQTFGAGNEPTKLEMDELMKLIPNNWWDGELSLTQKQVLIWQLNLIRKNTNAIIALGGTII